MSAAAPVQAPRPSRPRQVVAWARRAVLLYLAGAAVYLTWRFDVETLPPGGLTPLHDYRPGSRLLIDRRGRECRAGDGLLFEDELGRTLLARLAPTPAGEARAGLWLLADDPALAHLDSRELGPIPRERIVGRVVCALPGLD